MVKCLIDYKGELRCELTHVQSQASTLTDAPLDNCGRGEAFSPTDFLCSSMAACMATIMGIYAQKNEVKLEGLQIEVIKHMCAEPRRVGKIETKVFVPLPECTPHKQALIDAAMGSPVMCSIHPDIEVPIEWIWQGA